MSKPIIDQVRDLPPARRIWLALGLFTVITVVTAGLWFVFIRQPDEVLFSNLKPIDAATIVAELEKKKIAYRLEENGTTILVAKDKVDATRLEILSQDIPLKGAVGFELFNKSDIGLTEFAQKINYQRALQGELARTIMGMDGIDTARVHLSLPDPTIFREDKRPPKASIALTLRSGQSLAPQSVLGIQRLVAAAIPELDPVDVVVLGPEGRVLSADTVADDSGPSSPGQQAAETYFAARVRQGLQMSYPNQPLVIRVVATALDLSDDSVSGDEAYLQWSEGTRRFALRVRVESPAARDPDAVQNIRSETAMLIDFNPTLGDEIIVASAPTARSSIQAQSDESRQTKASPKTVPVDKHSTTLPWGMIGFAALVMIVVTGLLGRRLLRQASKSKMPKRRLSDAERQDFANRFQTLLDQGEG